jgi:hypothetical protein
MQFHIRTLLVVTTAISILLAVVFAAPPILSYPILCGILWICPSLWINGIIYGRGAWRPFFIGGVMAGIGPHFAALYYSFMVAASLFDGNGFQELMSPDSRGPHLLNAAILLSSGPFALAGGLVGAGVYWFFLPAQAPARTAAAAPSSAPSTAAAPGEEYLVVSGRIAPHRLAELRLAAEGDKQPLREPLSS